MMDAPQHRFSPVAVVVIATALIAVGCGETVSSSPSASSEPVAAVASTGTAPPPSKLPATHKRRAATARAAALGHRTKFSGCHVRGLLPDPPCTPGAIFAGATVGQICTPGYSQSVRNVSESVKQGVYAEYGIASHVPGSYEVDHLVSLELGGNNSVANLWPEISPGYHEKDGIENRLHDAVCSGSVSLRTAQLQIARDWRHTAVGAPTAGNPPKGPAPRAPRSTPPSSTPSDFCTSHRCIPSFNEGTGSIVQCADGEWSHSGGHPGVCSGHGGLKE
jgi:hypothetical protein